MKQRAWLIIIAALLGVLAACSPEDGRQAGQLGADVNNKVIVQNAAGANQPPAIQPHSKVFSTERP